MTLHTAAVRLAMRKGNRADIARQFAACLAEYEKAAGGPEEVRAVHHMVGVFYHNCGNQRLDDSMLAIQGQQLLLRYIYSACGTHGKTCDTFQRMYQGILDGDTEAICAALQESSGRMEPVLLAYVRGQSTGD